MRIIHTVENYYPSIGGMQEVVKRLSEGLAELGHNVTVVTSTHSERKNHNLNQVKIVDFEVRGNIVRGMRGQVRAYQDYIQNTKADIITNFAAQQWTTDAILPLLPKLKAKKVFVPTGFSGLYAREYHSYFERLQNFLQQYDINVFLSENYRDLNFARDVGIKEWAIIPNGASLIEFNQPPSLNIRHKLGIDSDARIILHIGSHTSLKGHKEALAIFEQAQITNAVLVIIGNSSNGSADCANECHQTADRLNHSFNERRISKKVMILELPRADTLALLHESELFLFPSNVECSPIVLFEALAARTPFLTTDVGNSAEIISWTGGGQLLPTEFNHFNGNSKAVVNKSAAMLTKLFNDRQKLEKMAAAGYKQWRAHYTWEGIVNQYETLYKDLLTGTRSKPVEYRKLKESKKYSNSVVIPVQEFNSDLIDSLHSLNEQIVKPQELLLVTHKSFKFEPKQLPSGLKVTHIKSESNSLNGLLNEGVKAATSRFISFIMPGDQWATNKLQLEMRTFSNSKYPKLAVVYSRYLLVDHAQHLIPKTLFTKFNPHLRGDLGEETLQIHNWQLKLSCLTIDRQVVKELVFAEEFGACALIDLLWEISRHAQLDYVFTPTVTLCYVSEGPFKDRLRLYDKWSQIITNKNTLDSWGGEIIDETLHGLIHHAKKYSFLATHYLTPKSKKILFAQKNGSFKRYLVLRFIIHFLSAFAGLKPQFKQSMKYIAATPKIFMTILKS